MDNVKVYYEIWQMMCCGVPFVVGDEVEWSVRLNKNHSEGIESIIDFFEDHHYHNGDDILRLRGKVDRILLEYSDGNSRKTLSRNDGQECRYISRQNEKLLYKDIECADGEHELPEDYEEWAYVITLSNVIVSKQQ